MKRTAVIGMLLAALAGCTSMNGGQNMGDPGIISGGGGSPGCTSAGLVPTIPGAQGPWGQPVPVRGPYVATPPSGEAAAKAMLGQSVPMDLLQQVGYNTGLPGGGLPQPGLPGFSRAGSPMAPGGIMPTQACGPNGCPPGMGPAMTGMPPMMGGAPPMMGGTPPGAVAAVGALTGAYASQFSAARTSVRFTGDRELYGMKVSWLTVNPEGKRVFGTTPLEVPGSYNFPQAAIYSLKLNDIPGYPDKALYPTLEVVPANAKTATFLAHMSVPVTLTREDLRTVIDEGNYLVKVIYLPDPQFQDVSISGTGELISTQLEPGADPITEACKRGSILLVLRVGNIDREARHSPPMEALPPGAPGMMPRVPTPPAGVNGPMLPNGMTGPGGGFLPPGAGPAMPPVYGPPMPPGFNPMAPGGSLAIPNAPWMPPVGTAPGTTPPPRGGITSPPGSLPSLPVGTGSESLKTTSSSSKLSTSLPPTPAEMAGKK